MADRATRRLSGDVDAEGQWDVGVAGEGEGEHTLSWPSAAATARRMLGPTLSHLAQIRRLLG